LLNKFDAKISAVFYKFHFGIIIAMVFVAGKKIIMSIKEKLWI